MYTAFVNSVQFKGSTKFLSCNSEGKGRRVSDCPFGTASFGDTRGLSDFVRKYTYPNAEVEETIGKLHDNITCRIYVADPNEVVDDLKKLQHDYIVYDREPDYPNVADNYFEENIQKQFEALKAYFKRLEAVEIRSLPSAGEGKKVLQSNLQNLRNRYMIAQECSQIYEDSASLREQKADLEAKIDIKKNKITYINETVAKYRKELEKRRKYVLNHEKMIPQKERFLEQLEQKRVKMVKNPKKTAEETKLLNIRIKNFEEKIKYMKYQLSRHKERISCLQDFIYKAPEQIISCMTKINECKEKLERINLEAKSYIKKICEIYTRNGIKVV